MFFLGIFLVFFKWPMIGMVIEFIGFMNLFGDFFPVIISFLYVVDCCLIVDD
jgi:hypothetical protein